MYFLGMTGGAKEVTITYWGLWEDSPTLQAAIAEFQTGNPKIKVTYVKQSLRQYRERLQAAITRGDGPDVFQFHTTWVPMLRSELAAAPATFMTTAQFGSTFYPVASADLVGGQAIYGVPLMFDGLGLYYNEDLFTTAGVKPPTTWPELLELVPKLTVKTGTQIQQSAIALGTTGNVENFSDIVGLMMMQNGARLTNPTGKEAEDTLMFYRKFANPTDPVYTWNETLDNSIYAFAMGKVAMIIAPSWRAFDVKQINANLHFKIAPVPQLPGNTINWASYWAGGVSTKSKNQAAAWTFLKYLIDKNTMTKLYAEESKIRLFGEPYARVDLGSALSADPYLAAYIQGASTAKSFPLASRTFDNGINDKLIQYMTDAVNAVGQGTAPTAALQTAAAGFTQVLTSYGITSGAAPQTTP
jgi:multiple sugar transport system substrate-binding protein